MTDAPAPIPEEMVQKGCRPFIREGDPTTAFEHLWYVTRPKVREVLEAAGVPALLAELAVIDSVLAVGAVADIPDRADKIQALMNAAAIAEDRLYRAQARVEELEVALAPFACSMPQVHLVPADFEKARAALAKKGEGE